MNDPKVGRSRRQGLLLGLALIATVACGCTSFDGRPVGMPNIGEIGYLEQANDLVVGVRLPRDEEEVEENYGVDLLAENILPVEIHLAYRSGGDTSESYVIRHTDVVLRYENEQALQQMYADDVAEKVAFSQWGSTLWWFLGIMPGPISMMSIASANGDMEDDFRAKQLEKITVQPGERYGKVVFFTSDREIDVYALRVGGTLELKVDVRAGTVTTPKTVKVYFAGR